MESKTFVVNWNTQTYSRLIYKTLIPTRATDEEIIVAISKYVAKINLDGVYCIEIQNSHMADIARNK